MKLNRHFKDLQESYLFTTIAGKVAAYEKAHPAHRIIRMGIGDVTQPLVPAVTKAMAQATEEMATHEGFKGYPPDQGYDFLREAVRTYYAKRDVSLSLPEIFIGDGAKSDIGNILDIFSEENTVLIPDPVYPVYVDTNIMNGRRIRFMKATEENDFLPLPDESLDADIIYLCSPNNPTGAVYSKAALKCWVDYALAHGAVILFDAAYEAFITDPELPRSIFEIEGASRCAIEFCSLSKTAGFTGMRCGYTVISEDLMFEGISVRALWARRQASKFNGVSYVTQRAAEAVFSLEGQKEIQATLAYYMDNAKTMAACLRETGIPFFGGGSSPYIWMKCPGRMTAWAFFDVLLSQAEVVGTPGSGFGENGEGYFRLTSFGDKEKTKEAMSRIQRLIWDLEHAVK